MTTIAAALAWANSVLSDLDTPALDAACLLSHVSGKSRTALLTWPEVVLTDAEHAQFQALVNRRVQGEPIAYLVGHKAFWTFDLKVTTDTLIPRPETEVLVEFALNHLPHTQQQVLDLGTGSGAIALALAESRPAWQIWASDISPAALNIAKDNAQQYDLQQIRFHQGAFFEALPTRAFDAICSNPPYLADCDPHLSSSIRFEPRQALVANEKGLACINTIVTQAPQYLVGNGWLMIEHGYDQASAVKALFSKHFTHVKQIKDLSGIIRLTAGQLID